MNLIDFAQLGVAGVSLIIILFIVREFLKFLKRQEDNFNEIIKNHLHSDVEAKNRLEKSHLKLALTIEKLLKWLKKNNSK